MVRLSGALTIQMQCLWKQKSQQQWGEPTGSPGPMTVFVM
jgi:hypothetical protein